MSRMMPILLGLISLYGLRSERYEDRYRATKRQDSQNIFVGDEYIVIGNTLTFRADKPPRPRRRDAPLQIRQGNRLTAP
jgi:hypothetical protein